MDTAETTIEHRPRRRFGLRRWRETEVGQTLVEFSLVLPIILVMMFALVDFGRAFYTWLIVTNAAREGARTAAVQLPLADVQSAVYDAMAGLDTSKVSFSPAPVNIQGDRGEATTVSLTYTFEFVTPLGPMLQLIGGSNLSAPNITGSATMRLE